MPGIRQAQRPVLGETKTHRPILCRQAEAGVPVRLCANSSAACGRLLWHRLCGLHQKPKVDVRGVGEAWRTCDQVMEYSAECTSKQIIKRQHFRPVCGWNKDQKFTNMSILLDNCLIIKILSWYTFLFWGILIVYHFLCFTSSLLLVFKNWRKSTIVPIVYVVENKIKQFVSKQCY